MYCDSSPLEHLRSIFGLFDQIRFSIFWQLQSLISPTPTNHCFAPTATFSPRCLSSCIGCADCFGIALDAC